MFNLEDVETEIAYRRALKCIEKAGEKEYKLEKVEASKKYNEAYNLFIDMYNKPQHTIPREIVLNYLKTCALGVWRMEIKEETKEEEDKLRKSIQNMIITPENIPIVGMDYELCELRRNIVKRFKKKQFTKKYRNTLLFGPTGCGKTALVKRIAYEAEVTFYEVNMGIILSKWLGESEKAVEMLFRDANRQKNGAIIFMDEIDAILGVHKKTKEDSPLIRIQGAFKQYLDPAGTKQSNKVIVIGTTNHPETLTEAMKRRFPQRMFIGPPDINEYQALVYQFIPKKYFKYVVRYEQIFKKKIFEGRHVAQIEHLVEKVVAREEEFRKEPLNIIKIFEEEADKELPHFIDPTSTGIKVWIEKALLFGAPRPKKREFEWEYEVKMKKGYIMNKPDFWERIRGYDWKTSRDYNTWSRRDRKYDE